MPKIDVITVKLTVHIRIGTSNRKALEEAYDTAEGLIEDAGGLGFFATDPELRHNRVTAPEPKASDPAADNLELPENLRRTKKPEQAAAE